MTKIEVMNFIKKISTYYPHFKIEDEDSMDEWANRLEPYDTEDVYRKFEEHLEGGYSQEPPKLHYLTKYLLKSEDKKNLDSDYSVFCNLCGRNMTVSNYDKHYDKCLEIKTIQSILKKQGKNISYEELEKYPVSSLDKVVQKYIPTKVGLKEMPQIKSTKDIV